MCSYFRGESAHAAYRGDDSLIPSCQFNKTSVSALPYYEDPILFLSWSFPYKSK